MRKTPALTALIVIAEDEKRRALAGLSLATNVPHIILLDHHLPDMSDFDVCCRLKSQLQLP